MSEPIAIVSPFCDAHEVESHNKVHQRLTRGPRRLLYLALGWFFFGLGIAGALLPILPTTPFMILAVWAFGKSSPRFESWLLNHPWFGASIRRFREHRVVPWSVKWTSWISISAAFTGSLLSHRIPWWGLLGQALVMGYGAYFVARCPSSPPSDSNRTQEKF